MKLPSKRTLCLLPMLLLTGCVPFHKHQQSQVQPLAPPIEDTPPPKPAPTPTDLPPPVITIPPQPLSTVPTPLPEDKPKPVIKRKKSAAPAQAPAANTTQQASIPAPAVSAIGQLSSGDPPDLRHQTLSSIVDTERGLSGINRNLNDQEKKTADHIREFLKKARAALDSGDVDGATTLAAKAKVLLGELSR